MKQKRYFISLSEAKEFIDKTHDRTLHIWRIKKKDPKTGRLITKSFWVGTEFEWLNR